MRNFDVLVLGEINVDLVLQADGITPAFGQERLVDDAMLTIGSSSVIFACGARQPSKRIVIVAFAMQA